jgi:hypothetical protein
MPPLETAPADGTGAANFTRRLRHVLVAVLTSSYRGIIASKRGLDCPFTANLGSRGVRSAGLLSGVDRTWTSMRAPMSNHGEGPTPGRHANNLSVYRAGPEGQSSIKSMALRLAQRALIGLGFRWVRYQVLGASTKVAAENPVSGLSGVCGDATAGGYDRHAPRG